MNRPLRRLIPAFLLSLLLSVPVTLTALAQGQSYTVQVGDTLSEIALKYNVTLADLTAANNITNPNLIYPGQQLSIPNAEGQNEDVAVAADEYTVQPGDTLYNIALMHGIRLNDLVAENNIIEVNIIEVGQVLRIPTPGEPAPPAPLPAPFEAIEFSTQRIAQGRTLAVSVTLSSPVTLTAELEDRPITLSTSDRQTYWGLVGIHALSEIGIYSLAFYATSDSDTAAGVAQDVVVFAGPYGTETIIPIEGRESLLDPETIRQETALMTSLWSQTTPEKYWAGPFIYPVGNVRITSDFGTRRSYGGGAVNGYHAGTDFGGLGEPIFAPAPGVVVLADALNVRGNAVLVDHGLGVYSGFWHQTEFVVSPGDVLQTGDLIGYIGNTGLVTGPHLHWELRVGGIAVDPLQWVVERFP